tara:strand:- start:64 stop:291 length:228 start_codon:yes stop_codon:yes gene_type:complete
MILDKILSQNQKIIIAIISGCVWIYFRDDICYSAIPRMNIFSVIVTAVWIYLNYKDPLFLPIGLIALYLVSFLFR